MKMRKISAAMVLSAALTTGGATAISSYAAHPGQSYGCTINPNQAKCKKPAKPQKAHGVVTGVKQAPAPVVSLPKTGGGAPNTALSLGGLLAGTFLSLLGLALRRSTR